MLAWLLKHLVQSFIFLSKLTVYQCLGKIFYKHVALTIDIKVFFKISEKNRTVSNFAYKVLVSFQVIALKILLAFLCTRGYRKIPDLTHFPKSD